MAANYVSDERVYITRDGEIVPEDHPDVHQLLVAAGGELPYAVAVRHGLITEDDAANAEAEHTRAEVRKVNARGKALLEAPETQAIRSGENKAGE